VALGHNVELGYLSQHADTAAGEGTVLEAVQRETGLTGQRARDLLGGFLFSGEEADKRLGDISGGEQRRLSLAILVASGANFLILDEPTNHLDLESREALEDALSEYEGALILVSHDRALLEAVGSRTVVFEDGRLESHEGGWADYVRDREERLAAAAAADAQASTPAAAAKAGRQRPARGPSKNAIRAVGRIEERIEAAEAELRTVEDELADPAAWSSPGRSRRSTERHEAAKRAVEELYRELERAEAKVASG
jgi:ATP-binding cassette subfamily F protein 3